MSLLGDVLALAVSVACLVYTARNVRSARRDRRRALAALTRAQELVRRAEELRRGAGL